MEGMTYVRNENEESRWRRKKKRRKKWEKGGCNNKSRTRMADATRRSLNTTPAT